MQFIQGKNRTQSILFPKSLDQLVEQDNEVRMIDLFVESINLTDFKFVIKTTREGRPAYHPKDLLKLYVYGYLNHIRSSRQLLASIKAIIFKIRTSIFSKRSTKILLYAPLNRFQLIYLKSNGCS
jgi:transposase